MIRVAALVALFVACSGTSSSGPESAADYCEAISDSFCSFYLRCGRMDVASVDECKEVFADSCEGRFEPRYRDLESAGLLALSPAGVSACNEHLETVACDQQIRELSGPCRGLWIGQQPEGAACSFDVESLICEPGTECVLDLSLCGTCRPLAEVGDGCGGEMATCGTEAFCSEGVCVGRKGNGESCSELDRCLVGSVCEAGSCTPPTFVAEGAACDQRRRCQYQTACVDGTCARLARQGGSCSGDESCDAGYCEGGTCIALRPSMEACDRPEQCATSRCEAGLCRALPGDCL